ncbi:putative Acyl-CoA thioester hydrolase [Dinoroseobacter shibae DFL 12 = DSM 16493]|uniref:Putative Acyl-CoA thioester hydrolase n=1 Tax=Dinoroseobacter shibae (strain DSM 16493 / NCIMB 14021 / DFL 12) TaxID=398580 RepID=A8LR31_DINSH|nr:MULTISPECIES: acyl-CoA thioesterase [Dinoroseobacter]ABV93954.1 putative Acyl-CoA thioester hydrolase [Dinoroseobacter shibae DFL 12 = DSM 16493]MDD9716530.1 acyl-CoA thioesterase [Dinoroseobacter sp. PD6]URF45400.1 acyl-CoA thioesterase [Dinoroseobacter shibae]URF49705.1 acyl-CoA thioesterase [Dinoroseobacter shibae]
MAPNPPETPDETPKGALTLRTLAMPADVNVNGDIFGGWVLSQMDIAAGIVAGERAQGRVATVAIDAMKFIRPVKVGDVLCIYAEIERVGRSSMGVALEAWVLRGRIGAREKVTEALFTFVAIDEEGRTRPVPKPQA